MIIGEHCRPSDLDVNAIKEKKLSNVRNHGKDENVMLAVYGVPATRRTALLLGVLTSALTGALYAAVESDAKKLLEEKARFRDLEREYAASHIARLQDNTAQSIETSSLHLDLISDLKRINSHICSIAYPILDSAGVLSQTRIRHSKLAELPTDEDAR